MRDSFSNCLNIFCKLSLQAYAPELYLLEATPEVRAVFAASSEGSTRPQTRTSFDYNPYTNSQSKGSFRCFLFSSSINQTMIYRIFLY